VSDEHLEARRNLAAAHRVCVRLGFHEAIDNHLSLRVPGRDDEFFLSPFPLHWTEVTASNLLRVRLDGTLLEGEHELEQTAYCIHSEVHRAAPSFRCVMHTHMPYATAICCRDEGRLHPIHQHSLGLHDRIAYLDEYDGEVLTTEYGAKLARAMGDRPVLFLVNHGVIAAGSSVAIAFERLYYLERACQFQVLAESGGHALRPLPKRVLDAATRKGEAEDWGHADKHLAAWRRILDREEPDYAT
jgi:ribulose-5-phosphate 4-epimerase/fuculose-1-phosphate aldolase